MVPGSNELYWLCSVASDTFTPDVVTKGFDRWCTTGCTWGIDSSVILLDALENVVEMVAMFVFVRASNEGVINMDEGEIEPVKHLVHGPLEYLSRISKTLCDDVLWNILRCDRSMIICL